MRWIVIFYCFPVALAMVNWKSGTEIPEGEGIKMMGEMIKGLESMTASAAYLNLTSSLRNYTLDQKCELGLDLGVGFQVYAPYVDMGGTKVKSNGMQWSFHKMFPHLVNKMVDYCCPNKPKFKYGHYFSSLSEVENHFQSDSDVDISYPMYGMDGKKSNQYKDLPFIPVVTAPKIVLLIPDSIFQERNTRTQVLMRTILNSWPMLGFIIVSACLAGLAVWLLDKEHNSTEFPPTFFSGAWEGIWWAFVTMTTVGYGDRSPKSTFARAFCIVWILMGIIIISLFTGLVSAALSASATPVFNIAGAKLGAVRGSIEYQVGVGLNAEMHAFDNPVMLLSEVVGEKKQLHGVLVDNFILSANKETLMKNSLRMDREIDVPVTYGLVLKKDGPRIEKCFRRYLNHYPQKTFELISQYLNPVVNPADNVRVEVVAAEKLFYEESVFKAVVYTEAGILALSLIIGLVWEMFVRNKDSGAYRLVGRFRKKPEFIDTRMVPNDKESIRSIETLMSEYDDFHAEWKGKVKTLMRKQQQNNML